MANSSITVAEVEVLCQQLTMSYRSATAGYQPSANQLCFFVLVWVFKQQKKQRQRPFQASEDRLEGFDIPTITTHAREVIDQLMLWGEQVTSLKAQNAHEWLLVYKQMEKATNAAAWEQHSSQRMVLLEDALHKAYVKVLTLVRDLVHWKVLEDATDIVALVVDKQPLLGNSFDFRSGFYPFVRRVAHNEFVDLLRDERHFVDAELEDLESALPLVAAPLSVEDGDVEAGYEAARLQFCSQLQTLLDVIPDKKILRSDNQRQVVIYTLAGRRQFARALVETGLAVPSLFPPLVEMISDKEIAQILNLIDRSDQPNVNLVRVHRAHAEERVTAYDAGLGLLLKRLMSPH